MLKGNLIAQIMGVFGTIFLAKIYGEEAYGIFGLFVSILGIVNILNTLQLEKCIVVAEEKKESNFWFNYLIKIIPVLSIIIIVCIFFISQFSNFTNLNIYVLIGLLFCSIVSSINIVHNSLFTFLKDFKILSNSKVFITLSNLFFQIILYNYFDIYGLILGFIATQTILSTYFFIKNYSTVNLTRVRNTKTYLKSRKKILKFLLPANFLNSLAINLMPILILSFFGATEAGVYFLSLKILSIPLFLISSSVNDVYFKQSSELIIKNKHELFTTTKTIVITNTLIMMVFLIIINTIGIFVLEWFFGKSWNNLSIYIFMLSFLMLARITFNPISSLIVVLNKTYEGLIFNSYLFIVNLVAIYLGYYFNNIITTIITLVVLGSIGYLFLLLHFLNHLKYIAREDV